MSKEVKAKIKLQIAAGKANPSPPVGPALGQHGLPIQEFCTRFNNESSAIEGVKPGTVLPVIITVYGDRTFDFEIKQPPMSRLILDAAGLKSGSSSPKAEKVGHLSLDQMRDIATRKQPDLTSASVYAAMMTVAGTARSMGLTTDEFNKEDIV